MIYWLRRLLALGETFSKQLVVTTFDFLFHNSHVFRFYRIFSTVQCSAVTSSHWRCRSGETHVNCETKNQYLYYHPMSMLISLDHTFNVLVPGKTNNQKRRVVFRGDHLGNTDDLRPTTVRRVNQRTSRGELQSLVPKRRMSEVPTATGLVSEGDIWPNGRMLEEERSGQTKVRGDSPLPTTQELGLHAGTHMLTMLTPHPWSYRRWRRYVSRIKVWLNKRTYFRKENMWLQLVHICSDRCVSCSLGSWWIPRFGHCNINYNPHFNPSHWSRYRR